LRWPCSATPAGKRRLLDPRDVDWHHLRTRRFDRLRCAGCRERAAVPIVSSWHRRKGFDVVRASWPPDLRSNEQAA
jgi:hypothetical protein